MIRAGAVLAVLVAIVPLAGAAQAPPGPAGAITGIGIPMSGDELTVGGTLIRLEGIDAPEPGQMCRNRYGRPFDCDRIATRVLESLISGRTVTCRPVDTDRTGQLIGVCRVAGVDLGAAMVARGWAFAWRSLSHSYAAAEVYAQRRRFGLWAGQVEKPWQYRSRKLREQGP